MLRRISARTLGTLELVPETSDPPAGIFWKKHAALLVYLARSPERRRTKDHIVGVFWPDKLDSKARHSLREAVRVIRQCCGEEALAVDNMRVQLAEGVVELDVDRLGEIETKRRWAELDELVRGQFLDGFSVPGCQEFDLWMEAERRLFKRRVVDLLIRASTELIAKSDLDGAAHFADRARGIDAESDAATQAAMRSWSLKGQRGAAIEIFESFERLIADVGAEPDATTAALLTQVKRERDWQIAGPAVIDSDPGRLGRPPLVAREGELKELERVLSQSRAESKAAIVVIEGDGGTGKTRLTDEVLTRARLNGVAVTGTRAVESDREEPWSGVMGLSLGGLLDVDGVAGADPESIAAFVDRAPAWADRFPHLRTRAATVSPGRALRDILRAVCEEQQVVLCCDDAQWIDSESLASLESALRDLAGDPLVVWCTVPPDHGRDEINRLQAKIGTEFVGAVVPTNLFQLSDIERLARWAFPNYDDPQLDRVARRVALDSGGIPFVASELLQAVAAGLDIADHADAWPRSRETLDQTMPGDLPANVVGAIRVRYGCLTPDARSAVDAASVLGERVSADHIGIGAGLQGAALDKALDELEWQRWLVAEPRGYAFRARIVREVIARDMVSEGKRQRILKAR